MIPLTTTNYLLQIQEGSKYIWKPCCWNQGLLSRQEPLACIDSTTQITANLFNMPFMRSVQIGSVSCPYGILKEACYLKKVVAKYLKTISIIPASNEAKL